LPAAMPTRYVAPARETRWSTNPRKPNLT